MSNKFVQTDYTSQTGTVYKTSIDDNFAVHNRIAGAFAPRAQDTPDMTIKLEAGFIPKTGAIATEVVAQNTSALTAPSSNPRKDIVYIDKTSGTIGVATGAEASSPSDPTVPDDKIAIARITLATSTTTITNSLIDDIRNLQLIGATDSTEITKQSSDPTISTNPSGGVGSLILNTSTGKLWACTDATAGANVWKAGESGQVAPYYSVDFLCIAGGGAGGSGEQTGGGGAGGYRNSYSSEASGGGGSSESAITVNSGDVYTVTVGSGGASAGQVYGVKGGNGGDSSIAGTGVSITSTAGGGGGAYNGSSDGNEDGQNGGSGGGAGNISGDSEVPGNGTANQGYDGGDANGYSAPYFGAGGGGAGGVGSDGNANAGNGGAGLDSSITGSSVGRGGGGSSGDATSGATPTASHGGGGAGSYNSSPGNSGTANKGGGGAGGNAGSATAPCVGGAGGSGVVILRMATANYSGTTTGSPTVTTSGSDTILTFTGSGSYTG